MRYQQIEIRQVGWQAKLGMVLAAALGLGIVAALVILSLGLAILLLPVIAIFAAVSWFRWRKIIATARQEQQDTSNVRIIETEYEIVDDGRRRH